MIFTLHTLVKHFTTKFSKLWQSHYWNIRDGKERLLCRQAGLGR